MTTVIDLNILNLFRLKLKKFTFNDIRLNTQASGTRQDYSREKNRIIDITPYCSVVADNETDSKKDKEFLPDNAHRAKFVDNPARINKTYDRRGNIVQYFHSKGLYIDSYI